MNRRVLLLAGLLLLSLLTVSGPASAEPSQPPIGQRCIWLSGTPWRSGWAPRPRP